jgi:HD-GYP domain-containing protein (c-di-GMP phosphodiesterase class II)
VDYQEPDIVTALLERLAEKNPLDVDHVRRVAALVAVWAKHLGLPEKDRTDLITAALLHDIGKLALPDKLLKKTARLSLDEYELLKRHVEVNGSDLSGIPDAERIESYIRHHHENYNGFGYPDGLAGEAIPLGARILHIVEAYDSMRISRSSRPSLTQAQAVKELRDLSGRLYDPTLVNHFITHLDEFPELQKE